MHDGGAEHIYAYDWKISRPPLGHAKAVVVDPVLQKHISIRELTPQLPLTSTHYVAQRLVISDCFHKAKAEGYKWVAFGDADEFFQLQRDMTVAAWLDAMPAETAAVEAINWYHSYLHCAGQPSNPSKRNLPLQQMTLRANSGAAAGRAKVIANVARIKHFDDIHKPPHLFEEDALSLYRPMVNEFYYRHFGGVQSNAAKLCCNDACPGGKPSVSGKQTKADFDKMAKVCSNAAACIAKRPSLSDTLQKGWDL
eukprot:SAG31_NODE_2257_length_6072_cov_3.006864_2_plen_253_part_00